MSAKFIHTLSDENPDLQKHIGCMNGIFQLFDRHHFLGGGRRLTGQNHKRLPPGTSLLPMQLELLSIINNVDSLVWLNKSDHN